MWYCAGADLARRQRGGGGGVTLKGLGGWGVGWTVELKLNRKKRKKNGFQRGGVAIPLTHPHPQIRH